jgi:HPt (histidine-containing phosphotransfer) domain-containing protein
MRDHTAGGIVSNPVTAEILAASIEAVMIRSVVDDTATSGWPLLDETVLDGLARDIGQDGAIDVVRLFLAEAPRMTTRLEQSSISRGRALLREVHTLASAAKSVGLLRLGSAAADVEQAFARGEPGSEQLADLLDLLQESVVRLARWEASR